MAAALSLSQVLILLIVVTGADTASAEVTASRTSWIDYVDALKLLALAAFVACAGTAADARGLVRSWMRPASWAVAVALVLGAASFLLASNILTAALY
jgi:hypothetical protein